MTIQIGQPYEIYLGSRSTRWESKLKPCGYRRVIPISIGKKFIKVAFVHEPTIMKIPQFERHVGIMVEVAGPIFIKAKKLSFDSCPSLLKKMERLADTMDLVNQERAEKGEFRASWPRQEYRRAIEIFGRFVDGTTS